MPATLLRYGHAPRPALPAAGGIPATLRGVDRQFEHQVELVAVPRRGQRLVLCGEGHERAYVVASVDQYVHFAAKSAASALVVWLRDDTRRGVE